MAPRRQRRLRGSGTVYFDARAGRWVARVELPRGADGRRRQVRRWAGSSEEALRLLEAARSAPADRSTVAGFLGWFVDEHLGARVRRGDIVGRTAGSYRSGMVHVTRSIGGLRLADLEAEDLERLRDDLASCGLARSTQARVLGQLSAAFDVAVRYRRMERNWLDVVPGPKVPRKRHVVLEPEQARALLAAVAGDRLEPWYAVAAPLGWRLAEGLGLAWGDVDLDAAVARIGCQLVREDGLWTRQKLKGRFEGEAREVALPGFAVEVLRVHRRRQLEERLACQGAWGNDWDLVVVGRAGAPVWPDQMRRHIVRTAAAAGLPRVTPHTLRRSAASFLFAQGLDLVTVMHLLGWRSSAIALEVYPQALQEQIREAAARMDRLLGGRDAGRP